MRLPGSAAWIAGALDVAAAMLLGAALAAGYAGPLRFDGLGVALSVRTLSRPLLAAALILAARLWIARRGALRNVLPALAARVGNGALIVAAVLGWITFLSPVVGGVDSYGYVSTAERLVAGRLIQHEPLAELLPFPDALAAAIPLGYVPAARVPNASAPMYPLGLPALMAGASLVAGSEAPFWIAPMMGLVLLAAAYATARAWYDCDETALLAAALVALNPVVFTYCIQPMSDVPATAMLMTAVAALSARRPWPVTAGTAAAMALLSRPALAPALCLLAIVPLTRRCRGRWTVALAYGGPLVVAVALQGWSQWYLYGDPRASGYGSIAGLFSWPTAVLNTRSYLHWSFLALGPVWFAGVALGLASEGGRRPRLTLALLAAGIVLPYLFYRPYDHWETLRFLLPVIVIATVVAAAGFLAVAQRAVGSVLARPLSVALAGVLAWTWVAWLAANQVFTMPAHEVRHRLAGELVQQATPARSVVLALQHSGSLRYYTSRQTLNWDRIPSGSLEPTVRVLQNRGFSVYVIIDSEIERALFAGRHGAVLDGPGWLPSGQRRNVQLFEARTTTSNVPLS